MPHYPASGSLGQQRSAEQCSALHFFREAQRRTRTNISRYYRQAAKDKIKLLPSGLRGSVTLQVRDTR